MPVRFFVKCQKKKKKKYWLKIIQILTHTVLHGLTKSHQCGFSLFYLIKKCLHLHLYENETAVIRKKGLQTLENIPNSLYSVDLP